jgi:hypothetical protein
MHWNVNTTHLLLHVSALVERHHQGVLVSVKVVSFELVRNVWQSHSLAFSEIAKKRLFASSLSARPHGTLLPLDGFSWNLIRFFFRKCQENSSFVKIGQEKQVLHMKIDRQCLSHLALLFLGWEMFQTKVVDKIKTQMLCSITFFFLNSRPLWDNVEKYCTSGQATDGQYGACALHLGLRKATTHTQNM